MLPVHFTLYGVPFHLASAQDLPEVVHGFLSEKKLHAIYTPNPEIMLKAIEKPAYREVLAGADLNLPDGYGLLWATTFLDSTKGKRGTLSILYRFLLTYCSQLLYKKGLQRILARPITGADTFMELHPYFERWGTRVFYFGGEDGVSERIVSRMERKFPKLHVVGSNGGYPFRSESENEMILQDIEQAKPEVLFVALPFPKQEEWIARNRERLETAGVRMAMAVGGTLDFAVGKQKRAPKILRTKFEWLWRLLREPKRASRIFRAVFVFPYTILKLRLRGTEHLFDLEVL